MRPLPSNRFSLRARRAFTLLEILGVMALFALTATLVAANYDALPAVFKHTSPEDAVRHAFSSARTHALDTHGETTLRLVENSLRITDSFGEPAGTFEALPKDDGRTLDFITGDDMPPAEATVVPVVRFTAAGSTAPVRVRLLTKASGKLRVWRADPFSGILTEEVRP